MSEELNGKKLAAASIRRSSQKQEGNNSFEIQKIAIKEFAQKKGYCLLDEFIFEDDGVSAFKTRANKRAGLNKLKKVLLEENIAAVFFYDFSRIDRKIYSFVSEFYNDVISKKPHLKFFTTTRLGEWTPSDLDVKLQLIIANADSNDKSRRSVDSQTKDINLSKRPGSVVPYGFNQFDKKLSESEGAPIVLFIFYLASWGHSVEKIANILNDAKVSSPLNKLWRGNTIDNILKNPAYLGHLSWDFKRNLKNGSEHLIKNTHRPIVPKVIYQLIQLNRELKKKYNKLETPFLLSGLLTCKNCSSLLKHRNSSTKKNNINYGYLKYFCNNCSYDIEAYRLHETVVAAVQQRVSVSLQINSDTVVSNLQEYILSLKEHQQFLDSRKQVVLANENVVSIDGNELSSVFRNVKNKLSEQLLEVEGAINNMKLLLEPSELAIFLNSFQQLNFQSHSKTEQRLLLLYFIREVVVDKNDKQLNFDIEFKTNPIAMLTDSIG